MSDTVCEFLGCGDAIVFVQQVGQRNLRNNRFPVGGLEEGSWWEIKGENEEGSGLAVDGARLGEHQTSILGIRVRRDGLAFYFEVALERRLNHTRWRRRRLFRTSQGEMQVVQEPGQEINWIGLLSKREAL